MFAQLCMARTQTIRICYKQITEQIYKSSEKKLEKYQQCNNLIMMTYIHRCKIILFFFLVSVLFCFPFVSASNVCFVMRFPCTWKTIVNRSLCNRINFPKHVQQNFAGISLNSKNIDFFYKIANLYSKNKLEKISIFVIFAHCFSFFIKILLS